MGLNTMFYCCLHGGSVVQVFENANNYSQNRVPSWLKQVEEQRHSNDRYWRCYLHRGVVLVICTWLQNYVASSLPSRW